VYICVCVCDMAEGTLEDAFGKLYYEKYPPRLCIIKRTLDRAMQVYDFTVPVELTGGQRMTAATFIGAAKNALTLSKRNTHVYNGLLSFENTPTEEQGGGLTSPVNGVGLLYYYAGNEQAARVKAGRERPQLMHTAIVEKFVQTGTPELVKQGFYFNKCVQFLTEILRILADRKNTTTKQRDIKRVIEGAKENTTNALTSFSSIDKLKEKITKSEEGHVLPDDDVMDLFRTIAKEVYDEVVIMPLERFYDDIAMLISDGKDLKMESNSNVTVISTAPYNTTTVFYTPLSGKSDGTNFTFKFSSGKASS